MVNYTLNTVGNPNISRDYESEVMVNDILKVQYSYNNVMSWIVPSDGIYRFDLTGSVDETLSASGYAGNVIFERELKAGMIAYITLYGMGGGGSGGYAGDGSGSAYASYRNGAAGKAGGKASYLYFSDNVNDKIIAGGAGGRGGGGGHGWGPASDVRYGGTGGIGGNGGESRSAGASGESGYSKGSYSSGASGISAPISNNGGTGGGAAIYLNSSGTAYDGTRGGSGFYSNQYDGSGGGGGGGGGYYSSNHMGSGGGGGGGAGGKNAVSSTYKLIKNGTATTKEVARLIITVRELQKEKILVLFKGGTILAPSINKDAWNIVEPEKINKVYANKFNNAYSVNSKTMSSNLTALKQGITNIRINKGAERDEGQ